MATNNNSVKFTPEEAKRFELLKQEHVFIFPELDEFGCVALAKYLCRDCVNKINSPLNPMNKETHAGYIENADPRTVDLINKFMDSSADGNLMNLFGDPNDNSKEVKADTEDLVIYLCSLNPSQMEVFIKAYNDGIDLNMIRTFVRRDISFYISNVVYLALKQDNINLMDYVDIDKCHPYVLPGIYNAVQRGIFDSLSDLDFGDSRTSNILLLASYAADLGYGFVYDRERKTFVAIPVDELDDDTDIKLSISINKEKMIIE